MKWARTFLAIGYTTDHANITRMLPDLQKPCKRSALHACKQPQTRRKAKRVDVREKEATQNGEKEKEREIHAAVEPRAELQRADETKGIGDNKIHVTSETVSPNANMGSRKELCEGRTYSSRGHGSTQVLAVELLEKVSVRMRCARPTLSSRRTWYPH